MEDTVISDDLGQGSLKHIKNLKDLAILKSYNNGEPFREEDYKWLIGTEICVDIMIDQNFLISDFTDRPMTMLGITVEYDFNNPRNIQLWKNITNDI